MAQNITPTTVSSNGGAEYMRSPRGMELVKLQGAASAANDTSFNYACKYIRNPAFCEGGSQILSTITGNTVQFTSLVALGNNAVYVWIYEAI